MMDQDRDAIEARERQRRVLGLAFIGSVMLTFAIAVVALAFGHLVLGLVFVLATIADLVAWRVILRRFDR